MQMPFGVGLAVRGTLVEAHRIREGNIEQLVIAGGHLLQDVCQQIAFNFGEGVDSAEVSIADDKSFKRPHRPERHQHCEAVIAANQPVADLVLEFEVLAKQAGVIRLPVQLERFLFACWFVRQCGVGPNLAMRMRIAGAHHDAAVLEDLNVIHPGDAAQLLVLLRPYVYNVAHFARGHARNREIVSRRKTYDAADAALSAGHD